MSKYLQKYEVDTHLLYKFASNYTNQTFSTYDLGWWLETKTEQQFTVVQVEVLKDMLRLLELQEAQIKSFTEQEITVAQVQIVKDLFILLGLQETRSKALKDDLLKNLDCLKRSNLEAFLTTDKD